MKLTNEMLQGSLNKAYELFERPDAVDMSLPVKESAPEIARYMAETAAKAFLESIPEDDLSEAVSVWNDQQNKWVRMYVVSRMAERANDETYTESYRKEFFVALGKMPLGINGMEITL